MQSFLRRSSLNPNVLWAFMRPLWRPSGLPTTHLGHRTTPILLPSRNLEIPQMSPYWSEYKRRTQLSIRNASSDSGSPVFVFLIIMLHKRKRQAERVAWLRALDLAWKHPRAFTSREPWAVPRRSR